MALDLVDLHTHTNASDGSDPPARLVAEALKSGLQAVAVTDHDTIDGLAEALAAGRDLGLAVVPGVEVSVEAGFKGGIHVLGLWVDPEDPGLRQGLARLQEARRERNPRIAERLRELGIPLEFAAVEALAGGGQVGRPHFAQALVAMGAVKNRGEAFNRYLAAGKPAYVAKYRFEPGRALAMIRGAGGVPILAHPGIIPGSAGQVEALIERLRDEGLEGLEAYYSEHDSGQTQKYLSLAARLGLAVSGGSDYHGAQKPDIRLGTGFGELRVPAEVMTELVRRRDQIGKERKA